MSRETQERHRRNADDSEARARKWAIRSGWMALASLALQCMQSVGMVDWLTSAGKTSLRTAYEQGWLTSAPVWVTAVYFGVLAAVIWCCWRLRHLVNIGVDDAVVVGMVMGAGVYSLFAMVIVERVFGLVWPEQPVAVAVAVATMSACITIGVLFGFEFPRDTEPTVQQESDAAGTQG